MLVSPIWRSTVGNLGQYGSCVGLRNDCQSFLQVDHEHRLHGDLYSSSGLCRTHGYDYMNFRCWIGLWTALILLIMVVTDASYLVKYITRFTGSSHFSLNSSQKLSVVL